MARQTASPPLALKARRVLNATPQQVFDAWTVPALLRGWFAAAEDFTTPLAEVDLRVGGRYRLGMQPPGGAQVLVATGEYLEIEPPSRLVFTWQWEGTAQDERLTLVTLALQPHGAGTQLVLTHEQFDSAANRDQHALGWQGCLNQLERLLEAGEPNTTS